MIPFLDLKAQYASIKQEIDDAVLGVLASTQYVLGEEVSLFEQEFAAYCNTRHAVAVNTGTNVPSVATPNGQAAFLFLLTSTLAPLIHISYVRMAAMALPYTVTMTTTGLLATIYLL